MTLGPQAIGIGPQEIGGGGGSANSAKRELIFTARSTAATQNPTALDTPLQVEFGPAQGGVNTPLQIDASGNITVNESGTYYLTVTLQTGREGASGISMVYGRLLVDGTQAGGSVLAEIDNANVIIPLQFNVFNDFTQGQVITVEIYRDAGGNNSGGLVEGVPSLSGSGWSNAETATITASRLIPATQSSPIPVQDRSNYVLVKQKSDFPNAVGGVITLLSNTDYEINGSIDLTGDRIALNGSNAIFGQNPELDILLTNNATSMIEGRDAGAIIDRLTMSNSGGPVFDIDDITTPNTNNLFVSSCVIASSLSVGTFNNLLIVQFEKNAFQSCSDGVKISGADNTGLRFNGNIVENTVTGTLVDLGTSVSQAVSLDHNFIEASAGLVFIDGAAGSGNISTSGQGTIIANTTFGGNTPTINGIGLGDVRWEFATNNNIPDSVNTGLIQTVANSTDTVISTSGVDVKVAGNYSSGTVLRYQTPANGTLRYVGGKSVNSIISVTATCQVVAFISSTEVRFRVYVNGAPLTGAQVTTTASSGDLISASITSNTILDTNDEIDVRVANLGSTQNILVTDLVLTTTS